MINKSRMRVTSMYIDDGTYIRLKMKALEDRTTLGNVIRTIFDDYFERLEEEMEDATIIECPN